MAKKLCVVLGATGNQGSSVAHGLLKTGEWNIRAVTRNASGDKAKKLAAEGMEVVQANYDDEESIRKAFSGAQAIFAVTNWWEAFAVCKSQSGAGDIEERQGIALAKLAGEVKTLEHFIWSTLPPAHNITNGKYPVPHFDYKAKVDDHIRNNMPELAAKTTFLMFGFYPSNFAYFGMLKPLPLTAVPGTYIWMVPTDPSTLYPMSGDMTKDPGVWARQILANPKLTHGKYAAVCTEVITLGEALSQWSEVSGKKGVYVHVKPEVIVNLFGLAGAEANTGVLFGEAVPDWWGHVKEQGLFVSKEELGIRDDEVSNFKQALESLKEHLG
ncbi:NAD(P)-binding protein [Corynespora cassiicola Philippines]|uniref:NAD(P)-binding protein n=1 Tax=Corynespora cassiicola Philippines TaxID=1448308 RepID=A0A2T2PE90_CORCC|nr:NAD(P)-binding protein [Corynespora cassiicola Philippines]